MSKIYVLAGPSGVGKGTIVNKLKFLHPELFVSVSMTTRLPREGEIDGVHYNFVTRQEFERMIDKDQILEYAFVHGQNYYGTPILPLQEAIKRNVPCLLEIDLDGVHQIKNKLAGKAVFIFIAPPSWEELKKRLLSRGTESLKDIETRLKTAEIEMNSQSEFDYVVVNDDLAVAVKEIASIMKL